VPYGIGHQGVVNITGSVVNMAGITNTVRFSRSVLHPPVS
jgi:hypothetical protein